MQTFRLCECGCGERTALAARTDSKKGIRKGEPNRFVCGHSHKGKHLKSVRYVEEDRGYGTPCWIWQLAVSSNGYGNDHNRGAHIGYWEQRFGPVPDGLELDHLCRNRACVNPDHLEAVTHAENRRRSKDVKLSMEKAEEIRRLSAVGWSTYEIAPLFDVSPTCIGLVVRGERWAA